MQARTRTTAWPGWLDIALEPRAYGALIYQLVGLPLGILGFTWLVTGLSLSLGLSIIGLGLLLGFGFVISVRGLALAEGHLVWNLSGMPSTEMPLIPEGNGFWGRFRALLVDPATWLSQVYLLLRLPMGILGFTLLICLITLSSACILAAGLHWASTQVGADGLAHVQAFGSTFTFDPGDVELPASLFGMGAFGRVTAVAVGLLGLLGSLHLALALTWMDGCLAKALLSRK